jgi:hypothetical protein
VSTNDNAATATLRIRPETSTACARTAATMYDGDDDGGDGNGGDNDDGDEHDEDGT